MRKNGKTDANHTAIVDAVRAAGFSVLSLSALGKGVPDALFGGRGWNLLAEFKDGAKPPSARKLTKDQEKFHGSWIGPLCVVESPEQAVNVCRTINEQGA